MNAQAFRFELELDAGILGLRALHHPAWGPVFADWTGPDIRRRVAAGRRQLLGRAVGLDKHPESLVLDATAGLGRDGFTLAALGARVRLVERDATVHALLEDALRRALADPAAAAAAQRLEVLHADATGQLSQGWDVIYLDPMYPGLHKTALAKKELQVLRELTGGDPDADALLAPARRHARRRVVVKRPLKAPPLAGCEPHHRLAGSQARFDVYLPAPL